MFPAKPSVLQAKMSFMLINFLCREMISLQSTIKRFPHRTTSKGSQMEHFPALAMFLAGFVKQILMFTSSSFQGFDLYVRMNQRYQLNLTKVPSAFTPVFLFFLLFLCCCDQNVGINNRRVLQMFYREE